MGNGKTEERKLHKSVMCNCIIFLENSYNSYFLFKLQTSCDFWRNLEAIDDSYDTL